MTIEFKTHDDDKNSDTTLNIHIVNRISATESQDISVATDVAQGERFADSTDDGGITYKRIDLPLASQFIYLRDMVLPVVYINIGADEDQWIFDYRVTLFFGGQPYSWTVSGVVLDQDHHKHMGVYSGRAFPTLFYPMAPIMPDGQARVPPRTCRSLSSRRNWTSCSTAGKSLGSLDPLVRVKLFSSQDFGDQNPPSYSDMQAITNDPPPPDGQPLDPDMGDGDDVLALHLGTRLVHDRVRNRGSSQRHQHQVDGDHSQPRRRPDADHGRRAVRDRRAARRSPAATTWTSSTLTSRCG